MSHKLYNRAMVKRENTNQNIFHPMIILHLKQHTHTEQK